MRQSPASAGATGSEPQRPSLIPQTSVISIVLSTDANGLPYNATLIASILRRTRDEVAARIYTRGFSVPSFGTGRLSVEFIRCDEPVAGNYPRHVNPAVFDRLRIIRDFTDWDRALVLDHDMIVLCDLAEYFGLDFEGNLLAGRLFGPGNTLGLQMKQRGGLPEAWEHCADHPYFYMGPMMNLAAMREEGTWERLLEAHAAIGQDEQISLTAATGGRVKDAGKKWNLVPPWDNLEAAAAEVPVSGRAVHQGIPWKNRVPEGIIHWTGWHKPWHYQPKVWRPELWEAERTSWEQLRMGIWDKPLAVEVGPSDFPAARALVRRGWKVTVITARDEAAAMEEQARMPHPDLEWVDGTLAEQGGPPSLPAAELLRFGSGAAASRWPAEELALKDNLVIRGPVSRKELQDFKEQGFAYEARLLRKEWPSGGPHPKAVTCHRMDEALAVGTGYDLYLSKAGVNAPPPASPALEEEPGQSPLADFIEERLPAWMPQPRSILLLGADHLAVALRRVYPDARILAFEHDVDCYFARRSGFDGLPDAEFVHVPLDPILPWYDLGEIELPPAFDLIVVGGTASRFSPSMREASISLRSHLDARGTVIVEDGAGHAGRECVARWAQAGLETVEEDECMTVLQAGLGAKGPVAEARSTAVPDFQSLARETYVISLPEREDRRDALRENWAHMGLEYKIIDGIRPGISDVRWEEMKGMEAYGKFERLRGEYVQGAVGCKRAGIKALRAFLDGGAETALICQDDCRWTGRAPLLIAKAMADLPEDWDLLYFSASARQKHQPFSPYLVKLRGARLCTAILWTRSAAERILPELEACDCEWDLLMQRSHACLNAYCVVPMPAFQAKTRSDIAGDVIQQPNR